MTDQLTNFSSEANTISVTENPEDEPQLSTRTIIIISSAIGVAAGTVLTLGVVWIVYHVCRKRRKAKATVQNVKYRKRRANPEDPINHSYEEVVDKDELVDNQELADNEEVIDIQDKADKNGGIAEKGIAKERRPPPEPPTTAVPRKAEEPLMPGHLGGHSSEDNDQSEVDIYGFLEIDPKAEWKVNIRDVMIEDEELSGANGRFADIRLANMQTDTGIFKVVAKMNKDGASDEDKLLMRAKINYHAKAVPKNEHILKFIGEVLSTEGPILLTEYCEGGKLVDWVKKDDNSQELKTILTFCHQIATAMKCLHDNNIVHRRLGARNVLLKIKLHNQMAVKVTGFGPMKGEHDGKGNEAEQELVPIKWLAPEQLVIPKNSKRIYNNKTDVWSYGITLHEIFNKGIGPFAEMKRSEFKQKVQQGYKIDQCEGCPDKIYDDVMLKCWSLKPHDRPEFNDILKCMRTMDNDSKSMQEVDDDSDDQDVYGFVFTKGKTMSNGDYHQEGYEKVEYNITTA